MPKIKMRKTYRVKSCAFCGSATKYIDYKDLGLLRRFVSEKGKIKTRRATGVCARHERLLARAIKRARFVGLIPYKKEKYR